MTILPLILVIVILINIIMNLKDKKIDFISLLLYFPLMILSMFGITLFDSVYLTPLPLMIYYFIRLIKTRKPINGITFIAYIVLSYVVLYIFGKYENATCEGWCAGTLVLLLMSFVTIGYMVFINILTYIVNKIIEYKKNK